MKFPVFSLLAGNLGSRDGFARDCLLQRRVQCEPSLGFAGLLDRKWTGKLALNDNLAIHSKDSFWTLPKDQASLNALARTTRRRPVQTGRLPVAVLRFVKEFEPAFPSVSSLSEIQGS